MRLFCLNTEQFEVFMIETKANNKLERFQEYQISLIRRRRHNNKISELKNKFFNSQKLKRLV